jgi:hypothetical protein
MDEADLVDEMREDRVVVAKVRVGLEEIMDDFRDSGVNRVVSENHVDLVKQKVRVVIIVQQKTLDQVMRHQQ